MILPDINLLLYAHIDAFAEHDAWRRWWNEAMNGDEPIGFAEAVVFGFLRVATSPRAFRVPLGLDDALACAESWLEHPNARLLPQSPESVELAFGLLRRLGTAANLTTDAQIAALAIHHQATVCSRDTDFARVPGLRWRNPLDDPDRP